MKMITYTQLEQDRQEYIQQQKQTKKEYPTPLTPEDLPQPTYHGNTIYPSKTTGTIPPTHFIVMDHTR